MALNPYETLGIEPGATEQEIKQAWRRAARRTHPDKNPDDPYAETRFKLVQESYEILMDPARRKRYDETGETPDKMDVDRRAAALLMKIFHDILNDALNRGSQVAIVASMRAGLDAIRNEALKDQRQGKRALKTFEKLKKRFRRKSEGQNIFADALEHQIEKARERLKAIDVSLEEIDAAKLVLEQYEDLSDEEFTEQAGFLTGTIFLGVRGDLNGDDVFHWRDQT